jgi:hypothetical protein
MINTNTDAEPDPLGVKMSKAILAEKAITVIPLCVDVVAPTSTPDQYHVQVGL